jgi:hypothetical protein
MHESTGSSVNTKSKVWNCKRLDETVEQSDDIRVDNESPIKGKEEMTSICVTSCQPDGACILQHILT